MTSQTPPRVPTDCSGGEVIGGGGVSQSEGQAGRPTCPGARTLPLHLGKEAQTNFHHLGCELIRSAGRWVLSRHVQDTQPGASLFFRWANRVKLRKEN